MEIKLQGKEDGFVFDKTETGTVVYATIDLNSFRVVYEGNSIIINEPFYVGHKQNCSFLSKALLLKDSVTLEVNSERSLKIDNLVKDNFASHCNPFSFGKFNNSQLLDLDIFQKVALSQSIKDSRYFLCGVYFAENGDIVATDGHRMSVATTENVYGNFILPTTIIKEKKGIATLSWNKDFAKVVTSKWTYFIRLINAQFPNYQKVIPNTFEKEDVIELTPFKHEKMFKGGNNNLVVIDNDDVYSKILESNFAKIKSPFEKVGFNGMHLHDIFNVYGPKSYVKIPKPDDDGIIRRACIFGDDKLFSVVMPCNI